jgi:vitamin B12 transporter
MLVCLVGVLLLAGVVPPNAAAAQAGPVTLAQRGDYVPLETVRAGHTKMPSALRRSVTLRADSVLLQQVLLDIANQAGLGLSYGEDVVRSRTLISIDLNNIRAADALAKAVEGSQWSVLVTPQGQVTVVPAEPVQTGSIAGRVTDKRSDAVIIGAAVVVDGTTYSANTGSDGRYRIAEVPTGTYTVRARYIGYTPGSVSVTVSDGQEATVDFALGKSVQRLDEVVTTGTLIPTEVKALPTPVSVITESDIAAQRPNTLKEVIRQAVPSAVVWDVASVPNHTGYSTRGANTLADGSGTMKVFVDGIEVADKTNGAFIDPNAVSRVEVIRGPQAAAIYGSDAVGGVIQVFTKRGDPSLTRPQLNAEAAAGVIQTPYPDYDAVLRQEYAAAVSGGGSGMSYNFGGAYSHTPDWVSPVSGQSSASVHGGVHITRGILTADVSGRRHVQNSAIVFNPNLAATGSATFSQPFYQPLEDRAQTVGMRLALAPTSWWRHTLTAGIDGYNNDISQTQPRLTNPADTFLVASNYDVTKASIGYNTSLSGAITSRTSGSVTVGFDHYSSPVIQWFTSQAVPTGIGSVPMNRTLVNNTGYFAQGQLAFRDALFVTGGVRAEENSSFGDSLGTQVSPQAGLTYVRTLGDATLKVRGSWGRAIRPPAPLLKFGAEGVGLVTLPNPQLGPERQEGWDAGVDAVFGARGSLSLTYFDQIAKNLIVFTTLAVDPVRIHQYQNIGRVKNTGIEVEGTLALGMLQLRAQYGYARSRVEDLGPGYGGDLRPGDKTYYTPAHTAGASLTAEPRRGTIIAAGLTYVGSWNAYDNLAIFRCFAGTGPCQASFRDYIVPFPGFTKANATLSQQITPLLSGFVSVENLTNNTKTEYSPFFPVMGRITTVGLRFHN